ncbi:hypothetical protein [Planomonospora alba]|uniref:hypothetical protein n=1 Tax=Planomonospora alba TaxID=161354 RepID=UPI0031E817A0
MSSRSSRRMRSAAPVNSALARARKPMAEKAPSPARQRTLRTVDDAGVRRIVTAFAYILAVSPARAALR